jgi:hypothetical protein
LFCRPVYYDYYYDDYYEEDYYEDYEEDEVRESRLFVKLNSRDFCWSCSVLAVFS